MPRSRTALTVRQRAFVQEYLVDLNATAAYKRAGYTAKAPYKHASELLQHPLIAAEIQKAMAARAERTEATADDVVRKLLEIGLSPLPEGAEYGPDHKLRALEMALKHLTLEAGKPTERSYGMTEEQIVERLLDVERRRGVLTKAGVRLLELVPPTPSGAAR